MTMAVKIEDKGGNFSLLIESDAVVSFYKTAPAALAWARTRCTRGLHEPMMSTLLYRFMKDNPTRVFFDVGALYGYFTLLALAASDYKCSVHAFEMNPESARELQKTLEANPLARGSRVKIIHAAVSDRDEAERTTRYSGFFFDVKDETAKSQQLSCVRLDTYCGENGVPDIIKIDVEGFEAKVLPGAEKMLREHKPMLLLELHANKLLEPHGGSREQIVRWLMGLGYRAMHCSEHREAGRHTIVPIDDTWFQSNARRFGFMADDLIVAYGDDKAARVVNTIRP